MTDLRPSTRWILTALIVLAILVYIVLNWSAVWEPLTGLLHAVFG